MCPEGIMAESTTTRNFRENLKQYFDLARETPIAINRGAERYVLMSENEFVKMKEEVMNLQKSLISTLQSLHDADGTEYSDVRDHHDGLLKEILTDELGIKTQKKVAW